MCPPHPTSLGDTWQVRNPSSESLHVTAIVAVNGSFGEAPGPALVSAVANDADDTDAIISTGDTLTLTFAQDTDQGGFALNAPLPASWLHSAILGPHASLGAWSGTWTSPRTLALTLLNGSAVDAPAWDAQSDDGNLSAQIGIASGAPRSPWISRLLTPFSHLLTPSHALLTPFSHPSHTLLTPFSHPSHAFSRLLPPCQVSPRKR